MQVFNWGEWGNISDRYPGHPSSIDCMIPLDEDFICTGCMDGKLRYVLPTPYSEERERERERGREGGREREREKKSER